MADLNHCELIGRLGADPEVRAVGADQMVVLFTLATSQYWRDRRTGERKKRTEWIKVETWGTTARLAQELLTKGREIWMTGHLKTRSWETETSERRYATVIVCHRFQLLGPKPVAPPPGEAVEEVIEGELLSEGPPPEDDEIPF